MNNIKIVKRTLIVFLTTLILFSCVPTKTAIREADKTLPDAYKNQVEDSINSANVKWKDFFSDTNLVTLIDIAIANNQELKIMLQRVEMSKNEIKARTGEYLPFVSINAGAEIEKVGEFTRNGAVEKNLSIREDEKFPEPLSNFSAGLSASWELDIWKKLRNGKKIAVLEYLASVEGKNFMVTQLVSEIASTYYELMALDNQLLIIEQNLELQTNALRMVKLQKEAARVTQLAVRRFEAELLKNQSNKFIVSQQIVETENLLNFLVGRYPQQIIRSSDTFISKSMDVIKSGIPSDLLANRTDIKKAELELAAAKLNVSVAKANFYPSIGVRAGLGLEAFKPKFLINTPESLTYNLIGDVVAPLINRNAIKAEYSTANNRQLAAIFEYEKTILNAYIEVQNQLSNAQNLKESYRLKEGQVEALTESIGLSIQLFKSARAEYTEVLLTQREALDSKIEIIETKRNQLLANVKLYQALGGGWD
ncbi:TolC family protein [Polaribacter glomeratus]|uniref:RND transporter n=1 Tax=Polaribacter glomeratus TaxID=102 RepID=A0A2S7WXW1_9FLAO|nr:TolC family protein [Polaribacter glomeratus]PQJ82172.1 RND transporter [Polaribacter glomeratus]TXD66766.1 TolC family protein [Polaribacter glomeratus]